MCIICYQGKINRSIAVRRLQQMHLLHEHGATLPEVAQRPVDGLHQHPPRSTAYPLAKVV